MSASGLNLFLQMSNEDGAIGRMVFDSLQNETFFYNRRIELVGVIDISNESRDWAEKRGIKSFQNLDSLLSSLRPDVIIHTTASDLNTVIGQINSIVKENIPVVSSAEELFFPWVRHPEQAQVLNE